ncbi:MAG: biotin/lipoyl-containing protein [Rudaea sp.]
MSRLAVTVDDQTYEIQVNLERPNGNELLIKVGAQQVRVRLPDRDAPAEQMEWIVIDDKPYEIVVDPDFKWIRSHSRNHRLAVRDLDKGLLRGSLGEGRVRAPIPGLVTQVLVRPEEWVETGQTLLVLEAMKMENEIKSPSAGQIVSVNVQPGQSVSLHEVLAEIG